MGMYGVLKNLKTYYKGNESELCSEPTIFYSDKLTLCEFVAYAFHIPHSTSFLVEGTKDLWASCV